MRTRGRARPRRPSPCAPLREPPARPVSRATAASRCAASTASPSWTIRVATRVNDVQARARRPRWMRCSGVGSVWSRDRRLSKMAEAASSHRRDDMAGSKGRGGCDGTTGGPKRPIRSQSKRRSDEESHHDPWIGDRHGSPRGASRRRGWLHRSPRRERDASEYAFMFAFARQALDVRALTLGRLGRRP